MEAAAAAAAYDADGDDGLAAIAGGDEQQRAWLREWAAAVAEWAPTLEQVEVFLNTIALLLALILYAASKADVDLPDDLLAQLGILCAAGALVINRARKTRGK